MITFDPPVINVIWNITLTNSPSHLNIWRLNMITFDPPVITFLYMYNFLEGNMKLPPKKGKPK